MPKHQPQLAQARKEILEAANLHRRLRMRARLRRGILLPVLTPKQLNQAVRICRQNFLVSDALLQRAGFNGKPRTTPQDEAALEAIENGDEWQSA